MEYKAIIYALKNASALVSDLKAIEELQDLSRTLTNLANEGWRVSKLNVLPTMSEKGESERVSDTSRELYSTAVRETSNVQSILYTIILERQTN